MKDSGINHMSTYYNQFIDLKQTFPLKSRHKLKNNNLDNIKIASKKLPPDFFRPFTRQNPKTFTQPQKHDGLKTPCFGDNHRQVNSLSIIPKQKINLQLERSRIVTLPVQQYDHIQKQIRRKNCTREHNRKQQLNSHRHSNTKQLNRMEQHSSIQRQKIRYKKITLNDQLYLDEKKTINLDYENRIRLNIKKFFQQEAETNHSQTLQVSNNNINSNNASKSARRPMAQLQKLSPPQLHKKLKARKLPPIV